MIAIKQDSKKEQRARWRKMVGQVVVALVLGVGVLALLFREGSGIYLLFDHEPGFSPPNHLWVLTGIGAFGGLLLVVTGYVASEQLKSRHSAYVKEIADAKLTPQQRRISFYQDNGYKFVSNLEFDLLDQATGESSTVQATLVAEDTRQDDVGITTRTGALIYGDGKATDLQVATLLESKSWRAGDVKNLLGEKSSASIEIADAVNSAPMRGLASDADYVVCFGLASNEENDDDAMNDALSDARAVNLCRAIKNLDLMKREGSEAVGLGLGQAKLRSSTTEEAIRQRGAVIVAVTDAWRDLSGRDISIAASALSHPQGVRLDSYSRKNSRYVIYQDVKKGPYVKAQTTEGIKAGSGIVVRAKANQVAD